MKNYLIYLSSTNFSWWNFRDKIWKKLFKKYLLCCCDNDEKSMPKLYDPLEVLSDSKEIVDKDISVIQQCDFMVSYISKKITIGTVMEIMYAALLSKIRQSEIVIFLIDRHKIHRKHPWIKRWVRYVCDNEEDVALLITSIIESNNQ